MENNNNLVTVEQLAELAQRSDERFIDKNELATVQQEVEKAINAKVRVEVDAARQTLVFTL